MIKKINLLQIIPRMDVGGAETGCMHVAEYLEKSSHKSSILTSGGNLLNLIDKKRLLLPFPLPLAMFTAKFFQLLPNPLLTVDQLKLLKYNNIVSGKYKTNFDIGSPAKKIFNEEVKKYSYMWREGGQFSKGKGNFN